MIATIQDSRVFVREVQAWVDQVADRDLSRQWRIARAFMMLMAEEDKAYHQGDLERALREEWTFFVGACRDEPETTYTHHGVVQDMLLAIPAGVSAPFLGVVEDAYKAALQNPRRRAAKVADRSTLFLLPG